MVRKNSAQVMDAPEADVPSTESTEGVTLSAEAEIERIRKESAERIKALREQARQDRKAAVEVDTTRLAAEHIRNMVAAIEAKTGRTVVYASVKFTPTESGVPFVKNTIRTRRRTEEELKAREAQAEVEANAAEGDGHGEYR